MKINAGLLHGPAAKCNNSCTGKNGYGWLKYPDSVARKRESVEFKEVAPAPLPTSLTLTAADFTRYITANSAHPDAPPASTVNWDINFTQNVSYNASKPQDGLTPLFLFNGHLFAMPARPTIMEIYEDGRTSWPIDSLIWSSSLGAVIDVYFKNYDGSDHPVHLHGYAFFVLSVGDTAVPPSNGLDVFPASPPLNTLNPVRADTILVPAHGWVYLRVVATNPGIWTFHCHIDSHNSPNAHHGMIMAFAIGVETLSKQYPLPKDFPKITGNVYQGRHLDVAPATSPDSANQQPSTLPVLILGILCAILLCALIFLLSASLPDSSQRLRSSNAAYSSFFPFLVTLVVQYRARAADKTTTVAGEKQPYHQM